MPCSAIAAPNGGSFQTEAIQLRKQLEAWQQTLPSQPTGDVFSATRKK